MIGMAAVAGPVSAAPTGSPNPGTAKIEVAGQVADSPAGNSDNDPHVDCTFQIVYEGATSYAGQNITAQLSLQSPSSPVDQVVYSATQPLSTPDGNATFTVNAGDLLTLAGAAGQTENGNNDSDKQDTGDPSEIEYHVKLASLIGGTEIYPKQKTFWIGGCQSSPSITTTASAGGALGTVTSVTDTATLHNASASPGGTITFALYGPTTAPGSSTPPTCNGSDLVAGSTSTKSVTGAGATSSSVPTTGLAPGTYWWVATYSGDANNNPAAGHCGDANESVTLTTAPGAASPTISTVASAGGTVGSVTSVTDTATLSKASESPGGNITFALYGPSPTAICNSSDLVAGSTSTVSVTGTSTTSGPMSTAGLAPGNYWWTASYSGDVNNNPANDPCGADGEMVTLTPAPGVVVLPTVGAPGLTITKVVNVPTLVAPGELTYTVVVANPGTAAANNVVVTDTNPPNTLFESLSQSGTTFACTAPAMNTAGTITCTAPSLAAGASTTFTIVDEVLAAADGTTVINTAVATATGLTPPPATATTVIPVPPVVEGESVSATPELTITKSVDHSTLVAPGALTYTVVVTNPGTAADTDVVMTDPNPPNTVFESLGQSGSPFTCTTPDVNTAGTITCTAPSLAAGASTTFTIVDEVSTAADGTTVVNTATVKATGLTPPPASAATVIPVPPVVGATVLPESLVRAPVTQASTLPLTGTDVRALLAAGLALILVGLGLFAKSSRMKTERI